MDHAIKALVTERDTLRKAVTQVEAQTAEAKAKFEERSASLSLHQQQLKDVEAALDELGYKDLEPAKE